MYRQRIITEPLKGAIYRPVGCEECHQTGYNGRLALMEMLEVNSEIADLVERSAPQTELRESAKATGFRSLFQEGLAEIVAGKTTFDEIKKVAYTAM